MADEQKIECTPELEAAFAHISADLQRLALHMAAGYGMPPALAAFAVGHAATALLFDFSCCDDQRMNGVTALCEAHNQTMAEMISTANATMN